MLLRIAGAMTKLTNRNDPCHNPTQFMSLNCMFDDRTDLMVIDSNEGGVMLYHWRVA